MDYDEHFLLVFHSKERISTSIPILLPYSPKENLFATILINSLPYLTITPKIEQIIGYVLEKEEVTDDMFSFLKVELFTEDTLQKGIVLKTNGVPLTEGYIDIDKVLKIDTAKNKVSFVAVLVATDDNTFNKEMDQKWNLVHSSPPSVVDSVSLQDCIAASFRTSTVSKVCDNCQARITLHKKHTLMSGSLSSEVLLIQLDRGSNSLKKVLKRVEIPIEPINLSAHTTGENTLAVYQVFAIVFHHGAGIAEGHCTALTREWSGNGLGNK